MSISGKTIRLGCGSAYSRDRPDAAVAVAERGNVQYMCCDRLAERTLGNAAMRMQDDPMGGYNPVLDEWFETVLAPAMDNDVSIIGNFGAANPDAAGQRVAEIASELGYDSLTIATITGDDVKEKLHNFTLPNLDTGSELDIDQFSNIISANAYIGADPIVEALEQDVDVIIGGRIGDLSLYLAPMIYEFDWGEEDLEKKAGGLTIAHLTECGTHGTGGNFAYPNYVDVPGLENLGMPIAEVSEEGIGEISKPPETGGLVTELSLASQLLYEIHDPENYLTPDAVVDVSNVELTQVAENRVRVTGAKGKPKPDKLKVLVNVPEAHVAEIEFGWGGLDALKKANRAIQDVVDPQLKALREAGLVQESRVDRIGVDAINGPASPEPACAPNEVRIRIAVKTETESDAQTVLNKLEPNAFFSVNGTGGLKRNVSPMVAVYPTLVPRKAVDLEVKYHELYRTDSKPVSEVTEV